MATDKELTKVQAAFMLGVSESRISQLISEGKLVAERTTSEEGKQVTVRIRESEVKAYKERKARRVPVAA